MYPAVNVLQELGRVTIAASRLDIALSQLWWHLDPLVLDQEVTRSQQGRTVRMAVQKLARRRLHGDLQDAVLASVEDARKQSDRRNAVVHQDWVLVGPDAMRPVSDMAQLDSPADLPAYLEEWAREAKGSEHWHEMPSRSRRLREPRPTEAVVAELTGLERDLSRLTDEISRLCFSVASAREVGSPTGWLDDPIGVTSQMVEGRRTGPRDHEESP